MKTVLVCGGGTGGHLYPALAILEGLRSAKPQAQFVYVGSRYGLETKVLAQYPWIAFYALPLRGLTRPGQRKFWLLWALWTLLQLPCALLYALYIVLKTRPAVIVGTGGYAAFSPVLWGIVLRIPTLIHEQNLLPGLVNRLLAPWVGTVCVTYAESAGSLRARRLIVTGLPIRPQILAAHANWARFQLKPNRKTVLVLGGSRGSRLLTETTLALRQELRELQFLIATGDRQGMLNGRGAHTVLVPYITEMGAALATANVVVARAGASTLAELSALRKPTVIVPWKGAAEDHQMANARHLTRTKSWCAVLPEDELSPQRLAQEICALLKKSSHPAPSPSPHPSPLKGEGEEAALMSILREIEVFFYEKEA